MDPDRHRTPRILAVTALIAGSLAAIRWASRHIREEPSPRGRQAREGRRRRR